MRRRPRLPARVALARVALFGCALVAFAGAGAQLACSSQPTTPLLLLITADTLRADHVGAYGGPGRELGLTPRLDALSAESLRFEHAFSPASYTLPSVAALMTGRYPEEIGITANRSLFRGVNVTLAEVLRLRGWRTAAVVSNYVLRSGTGIEIGFDLYDDHYTHEESNRDQPERAASDTTSAALAMLDRLRSQAGAGRFLWVHYQDPHGPYLPPAGQRERYLAAALAAEDGQRELPSLGINPVGAIPSYQFVEGEHRIGFYRAGYAGEVNYLDREIGRLLDGVEQRGLLAGATIVFTADHGESLGEDHYWFAHGELLSDALVHIPLWLRSPGVAAGERLDPASLVDLFPTLLALLGGGEALSHAGRDLLAPDAESADPALYMATLLGSSTPRYGLVTRLGRYVRSHPVQARDAPGSHQIVEQLWTLAGDEIAPDNAARARILETLARRLDEKRAGLRPPGAEELQQLSPRDREMLRQLGYGE